MIDFLGYAAGFLAMISFLPQVIKTLRTRKAQDISLSMLVLTLLTNVLYLLYGALLNLLPIVIMISIMTAIVIVQIAFTLKYRSSRKEG